MTISMTVSEWVSITIPVLTQEYDIKDSQFLYLNCTLDFG